MTGGFYHSGSNADNGLVKSGVGTMILSGSNTYTGGTTVSAGTLEFGDGTTNAVLSSTATYALSSSAILRVANNAVPMTFPWSQFAGGGTLSLFATDGTYSSDTTNHAQWPGAGLTTNFTGKLRIESGRVTSSGTGTLGSASAVEVLGGGQLLTFGGTYPVSLAATISGTGYGEPNLPGALRIAGSVTGTWPGAITLAADASVYDQDGSSWSLTGNITGAHQLDLAVGSPSAGGTLVVAPAAGSNTYGSTEITAGLGTVVAGNANAFCGGALTMTSGNLSLTTFSFTCADVSGGGTIVTGGFATASTLTVGSDNSSTTFNGLLANGFSAALSLTKVGSGTLNLAGADTYSGTTTLSGGILQLGDGTTDGSIASSISMMASAAPEVLFDNANALSYGGNIVGIGHVQKVGAGSLTLAGVNDYLYLEIDAGTVSLGNSFAAEDVLLEEEQRSISTASRSIPSPRTSTPAM